MCRTMPLVMPVDHFISMFNWVREVWNGWQTLVSRSVYRVHVLRLVEDMIVFIGNTWKSVDGATGPLSVVDRNGKCYIGCPPFVFKHRLQLPREDDSGDVRSSVLFI
jgi:hypothetical protein